MLRSIRDAVLVGVCATAYACASTLAEPATPPAAPTMLTCTVADVSFRYPDTMHAELSEVGTEKPTAVLYGEDAIAVVSVRQGDVDPRALRADAIAMVQDQLKGDWPWRALDYSTLMVLHVDGRKAKGLRMVAAHHRELWIAHVYTIEVGRRTVLLVFLYGAWESPRYDDVLVDLVASLSPAGGSTGDAATKSGDYSAVPLSSPHGSGGRSHQ
ncbi:MAG TPA: hypothetical protein VG755_36450 [Nannocystaceae bacterium]|nr:hypothetical protein [Nannocystaceae bacterium]